MWKFAEQFLHDFMTLEVIGCNRSLFRVEQDEEDRLLVSFLFYSSTRDGVFCKHLRHASGTGLNTTCMSIIDFRALKRLEKTSYLDPRNSQICNFISTFTSCLDGL